MAQSGYTPILIYGSGTASNIPSAANLTSSANGAELALNYADGKLYYKNSAGTVTLLADKISVSVASANGFAGSVSQATATSTPAITLSTSVTGVLVGNGTAVAAAVSGTDFKTINSTSILGSGNISITSTPGGSTTQVQYNNAGAFAGSSNMTFDGTSLTLGGNPTLSAGTANGVLYLNGSKVATSGSALTFDGTTFTVGASASARMSFDTSLLTVTRPINYQFRAAYDASNYMDVGYFGTNTVAPSNPFQVWYLNSSEGMRLTSTGLGIGTSSVTNPLTVVSALATTKLSSSTTTNQTYHVVTNASGNMYFGVNNSANSFFAAAAYAGIVWHDGAYPIVFGTNNTERMRLDSSGNLGLGVTPSAASVPTIQSAYGMLSGNNEVNIQANTYYNGGYKYTNTAAAGRYQIQGAGHYWYTAPSGTAGNAITFTQAMTLDASGRLGIGVTNPASALHVSGDTSLAGLLYLGAGTVFQEQRLSVIGTTSGSTGLAFSQWTGAAFTERARISSAGGFSVGTTADPGAGAIYATGAITAFYSDRRLKDVKGTIINALDKVSSLSGVYYTNNEVAVAHGYTSAETQVGLLAQDVEAVLPEVVKAAPFDLDEKGNSKSGEHYKTIQYERVIPLLVEAIKELRAEVQALRG